MKMSQFLIASAVAAALAVPIVSQAGPAPKPKFQAEKCYGIAKAGNNDCQTANSSCAGTSRRDNQGDGMDLHAGRRMRQGRRREHTTEGVIGTGRASAPAPPPQPDRTGYRSPWILFGNGDRFSRQAKMLEIRAAVIALPGNTGETNK